MSIRGAIFIAIVSVFASGVSACVGDSPTGTTQGTEGGPCFGNLSCNSGLTCLSNTCVRLDGSTGDAPGPLPDAGDSGGCTAPMIMCGGACINPTTDAKNCGACGTICATGTCAPISGVGKCAKRVFVTSTAMGGDLGGMTAQARCVQAAQNLPNTGTFLPWLSDSQGTSPSTKFLMGSEPIVLAKSPATQVAASMDDLRNTGVLLHAIALDENGVSQAGVNVWTNTEPKGAPIGLQASDSCVGWTNGTHSITGWIGVVAPNNGVEWTHSPNESYCDTPAAHLYCFEQ